MPDFLKRYIEVLKLLLSLDLAALAFIAAEFREPVRVWGAKVFVLTALGAFPLAAFFFGIALLDAIAAEQSMSDEDKYQRARKRTLIEMNIGLALFLVGVGAVGYVTAEAILKW